MLFVQAAKAIPERLSHKSEKFFGVGVGVGVGVAVGVADGVGTGVGEADGVGTPVGIGAGVETFTPLFQTSFLPDFTQVYLNPLTVEVKFNLEQDSPVLTAANAGT